MTTNLPENDAPPAPAAPARRRPWALLRDPLLQFTLIGVVLFGADRVLRTDATTPDGSLHIELTKDDLRQISIAWMARGQPAPTSEQLRGLVEQRVALEILSREARNIGLDRDDEVIKRRLAQKMEFLFEDVARIEDPTRAELREWYAQATNAARFAEPPRLSLRHLYFGYDQRGEGAHAAAEAALAALASRPVGASDEVKADPFMFRDAYVDTMPDQLAREFGPAFAQSVTALEPGAWRGPVQSGYGWHLVFVERLTPGRMPDFEEIEPRIKAAWFEERVKQTRQKVFEAMKARYSIKVAPVGEATGTPPVPAAGTSP